MKNNDLDKLLRTALSSEETPDLSLILHTKEKLYSRKEQKTEKIIILYMITLISIITGLQFFTLFFIFKAKPILGVILYLTFVSSLALIAFMIYYYKNSIKKYIMSFNL
ncbi:hypothetical protein SH2C18_45940 [Clostridium sediminicola]|uniref:hypothetical protein n=1 Tax=Clostridium sediminicola TaxID=3114879 RepID=UPI0031F203A1